MPEIFENLFVLAGPGDREPENQTDRTVRKQVGLLLEAPNTVPVSPVGLHVATRVYWSSFFLREH